MTTTSHHSMPVSSDVIREVVIQDRSTSERAAPTKLKAKKEKPRLVISLSFIHMTDTSGGGNGTGTGNM